MISSTLALGPIPLWTAPARTSPRSRSWAQEMLRMRLIPLRGRRSISSSRCASIHTRTSSLYIRHWGSRWAILGSRILRVHRHHLRGVQSKDASSSGAWSSRSMALSASDTYSIRPSSVAVSRLSHWSCAFSRDAESCWMICWCHKGRICSGARVRWASTSIGNTLILNMWKLLLLSRGF